MPTEKESSGFSSAKGIVGVTGAAGFVGRAVCCELDRLGWTVVPLVRSPAGLSNERILGDLAGASFDQDALHGLDTLVHAAARVHVMKEDMQNPLEEYRRVNTDGTLRLARAAHDQGVRRFIFISSIKVNGERTVGERPYRVSDAPAPVDAYGQSKLEAERGLASLASRSGLELVILRPVLVYGPGVKANFAALMALVRRGIPLPLALIVNRRSLIFVRNLADLVAACLVNPAAINKTFLAADAEPVSTPEIVKALARAQNRRPMLFPVSMMVLGGLARVFRRGAAFERLTGSLEVDISETRRILNWTPPFTMAEGLAATIAQEGEICA